jgi:hypothetical protein
VTCTGWSAFKGKVNLESGNIFPALCGIMILLPGLSGRPGAALAPAYHFLSSLHQLTFNPI